MPTCKACDAVLEPWEQTFDTETKQHEDTCKKCLGAGFDQDEEDVLILFEPFSDTTYRE